MKKSFITFLTIIFSFFAQAQDALEVQSNPGGLHITHTVTPGQNFFSVGRLYHVTPKEIAALNNLDMQRGLNVGQTVLIPLTKTNFTQLAPKGTPVFYTVGEGEGLFRVSVKNGKVLMATLRKWNKLANDNIVTGQKLIVGYLTSPEYVKWSAAMAAKNTTPVVTAPKETEVKETPKTETAVTAPKAETQKTVTETKTVATPVSNKQQQVATGGTGYFKSQYDLQSKNNASNKDATVTSGIFKTTSGWQDAKYYALLDKVEPGTIVQVINPSNNKVIYAKVLGEMGSIRQNKGLQLRLSTAAASALEISDMEKFIVRIVY